MKKYILIALLFGLAQAWAEEKPAPSTSQASVQASVQSDAEQKLASKKEEIIQEAVAAIEATTAALDALQKKDTKAAVKHLEKAVGKLELILAREPNLALAPVSAEMAAFDIYATPEAVEQAKKQAIRLLKEDRVQEARVILQNLVSEMVISVTNIPLGTYPEAIKAIIPLIDEGKLDEAEQALIAALNTLVITRHVIPLPLIRADEMLIIARALANEKEQTEQQKQILQSTLAAAEQQLKLAEALGYGTHEEHKALYEQIEKIKEQIASGEDSDDLFAKLKQSIDALRAKIFD